ncbi:ATP-binding cassette domain-containing protein [Pacificibacter maritimus]|uniref:ATP-binding cassette domain-containing protein n=1 Tax=Pacificibacter maritimus TaxID=762213 RepID=UPI003CCC546E
MSDAKTKSDTCDTDAQPQPRITDGPREKFVAPSKPKTTTPPQAQSAPASKPAQEPDSAVPVAKAAEPQPVARPKAATQALPVQAQTAKIPAPTAKAPVKQASSKHQARAELVATYASRLGMTVLVSDILDRFASEPDEDVSVNALVGGLKSCGLNADVSVLASITPKAWPALAKMTSGHVILVLSQKGDVLTIFDKSAPDQTAEVPMYEFAPFFSGTVVRASKSLASLTKSYAPAAFAQHWFWGQFGAFRKQIGEIALGSLVANLLAVAVALFSLQVYDRVIPHQSQSTLWVLAFGAVLAVALEAAIKLARSRLMDGAGRQIEMRVQSMLMEKLLGMRSDARPTSPSGLFSAMREFSSVREFFTASTIGTVADIPFIFLFFALVATIAGPVVWVLMLGAVIMVVPGYFFQKKMMRLTVESQGASAKASRLLHEAVFELDTIKTQRGEDRVRRIWDELNVLGAAKSSEQRKLAGFLTFWSQGIQQITYLSAVVLGTYLVFAGEFTVGTIIATGILTSRTLAPLTQLSGTMARWSNVKTALEGLNAIALSAQDADEDRNFLRRDHLQGEYAIRELQFRYDDEGAPTLDLPALDIKAGQIVAVLGANGSGKSSMLKVLAGLYTPTRGRVLLDGAEMNQIEPRDIRRNVGYLGQDVRLFAGTLRDNLNLGGLERDDDRLLAALDFSGLGPFVRAHHRGLDLEIRDGGEGLSVGQRQSIGWARLWLQNPSVCLLDEPTASLDQSLETGLVDRLGAWLQGRTALIATHRMPIVGLADRTMVLKDGRLVVDGPRDQVLAHLSKSSGGKA